MWEGLNYTKQALVCLLVRQLSENAINAIKDVSMLSNTYFSHLLFLAKSRHLCEYLIWLFQNIRQFGHLNKPIFIGILIASVSGLVETGITV